MQRKSWKGFWDHNKREISGQARPTSAASAAVASAAASTATAASAAGTAETHLNLVLPKQGCQLTAPHLTQ